MQAGRLPVEPDGDKQDANDERRDDLCGLPLRLDTTCDGEGDENQGEHG